MRCYFSILRLAKEKVGTGSRCGSESLHSATFAQRACPVPSPAGDIRRSIKFVTLSSFPRREEDVFLSAKLTCFFGPFFAPHSSPFKMDDGGYTAGRGVLGGGVGVGGCVGGGKETSSLVRSPSRGGVPRSAAAAAAAAAAARAGACIGGGRPRSRGESRL